MFLDFDFIYPIIGQRLISCRKARYSNSNELIDKFKLIKLGIPKSRSEMLRILHSRTLKFYWNGIIFPAKIAEKRQNVLGSFHFK